MSKPTKVVVVPLDDLFVWAFWGTLGLLALKTLGGLDFSWWWLLGPYLTLFTTVGASLYVVLALGSHFKGGPTRDTTRTERE